MKQQTLSVADNIIQFLVRSDITTFFGIPGGPISPIFDSILRCPQANLIESRHETSAAFAAASYFEETGKVAAVIVTAGPGGTNAVTGIASAFLKKIPILLICGDVAWAEKGERLVQDCGPDGTNMESIYASVTRKTLRINHAQTACMNLASALDVFKHPIHPGPVLVMLPMQVASQKSEEHSVMTRSAFAHETLDLNTLFNVLELLKSARKPLIVIGNGCRKISKEIGQLVNKAGIPFVTTPQAKGLISENHPMSLRNGGLAASGWVRKYVNEGDDIDVCLALGTDLDDCATGPTRYVRPTTKLIHVDKDPIVFNRNFKTFLPVKAELASFTKQLLALLEQEPVSNLNWKLAIEEIKFHSPFDFPNYQEDTSDRITPHRAIADLQAAMPSSTRYISDIGEHMLFALHYLTIQQSGKFHLHLNLGSMGSGIAGAIGLAIGNPHQPVVCICGDGGMQMNGMEILVAKKRKLPVIYAIFNDGRYNMVYHGFKTLYEYEHDWDTPPIDFTAWAASMGINAFTIEHPGDLTETMINESLKNPGPLVLDIRIDKGVRISGAGRNEHLQYMSVQKNLLNEVGFS